VEVKLTKPRSVHTSRTMMFAELEKVMDYAIDTGNFTEALEQNVAGKKSGSGVEYTAAFLKRLYGFDNGYPSFIALKYFWKASETAIRPLLAFVFAINHDNLMAESINAVANNQPGEKVTIESLEDNIEKYHPGKYSPRTRKSIAQNIASSWKQAGFIEGKVKNIRKQPEITYKVACFAFFLAYLEGHRGEFIWTSTGVKALCLTESALREHAIECAKRDLMQYQHAGSVTAISFRNLLTKTGIHAIENRPTAAGV
jgi:hypothetical protein